MSRRVIYILSTLGRFITGWYVLVPVFVGLGVTAGVLIFFNVSPGTPKIGVINVPFTVITEGSASSIGGLINYARRDDSIKGVVIKLSSPGGTAGASERLYIETRKLREEKPVVVVMGDLVASGGYMMSMGASYTYAQTSSLVGNVGVISTAGPLIPELPDETMVISSPYKLEGFTRRDRMATVDMLKTSFGQMVVSERGDKLQISRDELVEGRIYPGMVAVRLGLVDEIGGQSDAIQKAAELAGISNYDFVDVNLEVLRELLEDLQRILPTFAGQEEGDSGLAEVLALMSRDYNEDDDSPSRTSDEGARSSMAALQALRTMMLNGNLDLIDEDPLPDFPMDINQPNMYYLYVGHGP